MKKDTKLNEKKLLAAEAIVSAAFIGLEGKSNIAYHPRLKQMIAEQIAIDPSLTMNLFRPDFLNSFSNKHSSKNT